MAEVTPNNIVKPVGGTYGSFRMPKYRSVAFGTWKVGEARSFSERHKRKKMDGVMNESFTDDKTNDTSLASCVSTSSSNNNDFEEQTIKDYSSASDQQDDNLPENNETLNNITINSTTFLNFNNRIARGEEEIFMGPSTAAYNPDCYSSTEYLEFCMRKGDGIVSDNLPLGRSLMANRSMDNLCSARTSGYGTCSSTNNDPYTMSLGRHHLIRNNQKPVNTNYENPNTFILIQPNLNAHKRARSFDNATRFAVISSHTTIKPTTFGTKPNQHSSNPTSKSRFQATKNFLKRLYNNSTTLPRKLRGSKNAQKQPEVDHFKAAISPFYEIRYPEPEERPFLPYNIKYQIESDDEGADIDTDILDETSASSPSPATINTTLNSSTSQKSPDEGIFSCSEDKSMASDITSRSSSSTQQNKIVTEKFTSWNDLFSHLKKEIIDMRSRDAQILAHLKTVEEQLNFVKGIDRSQSEFTDLNSFLKTYIQQQSKGTYI